jgi:ribose-phosphate pyrophosphokinase
VDDLVDTAGTLCKGASALKAQGAIKVYACCTHSVLSGPAIDRLNDSVIEKLFITDTIQLNDRKSKCDRLEVVSVGALFGNAIDAIHRNLSISGLFL